MKNLNTNIFSVDAIALCECDDGYAVNLDVFRSNECFFAGLFVFRMQFDENDPKNNPKV